MATIDNLVTQGSVMPDNLRSDTARASLEYKNQLKNAGDIYVGTGTKITNNEDGVTKEIYVTEGKNIQKALNEDIFRVGGKNNIGLTNSDLSGYSNNIGIGKNISVQSDNNIVIGNFADSSGSNTVTIGLGADNKAEFSIVIGSASTTPAAVSGIALGGSARVQAPNAVQIGKGVNLVENSLQFHATQIVGGDGRVNATKINGVLSTDIFESDKKTVKDATNATNVVGTIDGRLISSIFSGDTSTVQMATNTQNTDFTNKSWTTGVPIPPDEAIESKSKYVYEIKVFTAMYQSITSSSSLHTSSFHAMASFAGIRKESDTTWYIPLGTVVYVDDTTTYIASVSLELKWVMSVSGNYGWQCKAIRFTAPFGKTGSPMKSDISARVEWRRIR